MQQWFCTEYLECLIFCQYCNISSLLLFFIPSNQSVCSQRVRVAQIKWVCVIQWHPKQVIMESAQTAQSFSVQGPGQCCILCSGTHSRPTQAGLVHGQAQLGICIKPMAMFVAMFAFLPVKQNLRCAAEEASELCLIKLILLLYQYYKTFSL